MEEQYSALALCTIGLEKFLQKELKHLQLRGESEYQRAGMLAFKGSLVEIFRANLYLRSAERILLEPLHCQVANFEELFEALLTVTWENFFAREDHLVIERVRIRKRNSNRSSHVNPSYSAQNKSRTAIQSQVACQSVVHKAIYQRLCQHYALQTLPETGVLRSLRIYVENSIDGQDRPVANCRIALDCSGAALHRRAYRKFSGAAPLKESIAAGFLLHSRWNRKTPFLDPFCGSGTLPIEAALFGLDIAPGLKRHFAMESFPCLPAKAIQDIANLREQEEQKARENFERCCQPNSSWGPVIFASDSNAHALQGAQANAERAGLASCIRFRQAWVRNLRPPTEHGLLLCNPPYGDRLSTPESVRQLYTELGELGRNAFVKWALGFVSNSADFEHDFAGTADRHCHIRNGQKDQFFYYYAC